MPKLDGTGPSGKGSRTGRGKGNCPKTGSKAQPNKRPQARKQK